MVDSKLAKSFLGGAMVPGPGNLVYGLAGHMFVR